VLRAAFAAVLSALLLGYVFPRVVGATAWDVRAAFGTVSAREAAALVCLWAAGLFIHSFVLTGALPGLSRGRALTLNLTGSAVANTLPFGGAAGMSLNYLMIRAWGVEPNRFAAFTLVTNLFVVLLKLVMPVLALAALWGTGGPVSLATELTALTCLGVLASVLVGLTVVLWRRPVAQWAIAAVVPWLARTGRLIRRTDVDDRRLAVTLLVCRDTIAQVLHERWGQMSLGIVGYGLLQVALLWACLRVVGAELAPAAVLAGFAVDRVMTLVVITPGAVGFVEAGTAAALIALGGHSAAVAAGVLLYRAFTFAVEIPVGGTWLLGWLLGRRTRARAERAVS
jgi:uncharacterized membrane protein YbhN (UPF0104 family)